MTKKALFLTDNNILGDVYKANLLAYVDIETEIVATKETFLKKFTKDIDLVISLSFISKEDTAKAIFEHLQTGEHKPSMIVVGQKSEVSGHQSVTTLQANLDTKNLIKSVAALFNITAKDMMKVQVTEYFPIPIKLFNYLETAPCDVFIQTSKPGKALEYAKVWEASAIRRHVITEYIERGVQILFVPADMRLKVINLVSTHVSLALDNPDLSKEQKLDVLEQGFEVVATKLTSDPKVNAEVVSISKKCIENVTEVIQQFPHLKSLLVDLAANKSRYLYFHSILATYICNHVVKHISWGGEGHADKISFVLYFHDIFLVPIYNKYPEFQFEEELVFNNLLSDKEKEVVINHARMAGELVKTFPRVPLGADAIVTQHHGVTTGSGFTLDFRDDVSPLAKVIIVAEAFVDELIQARDSGEAADKTNILALLRTKFPRHTYKKIIDTLENISV